MVMQTWHEQIGEIETGIATALSRGRTNIEDVAQILFLSKSTLQRRLRPESFTSVRRRVQLRLALNVLQDGREVGVAAQEVALSRDHLRTLIKEETGLTPFQIVHAARLASRLGMWKDQIPPRAGTAAYRRRIEQWDQADRKLQTILGDIDAKNPLSTWAKRTLVAAQRPDNRRRSNRLRIEESRKRQRDRWKAEREQEEIDLDAWFQEELSAVEAGPKAHLEVRS